MKQTLCCILICRKHYWKTKNVLTLPCNLWIYQCDMIVWSTHFTWYWFKSYETYKFIIIWCDISSGFCLPKITGTVICSFLTELFFKSQGVITFLNGVHSSYSLVAYKQSKEYEFSLLILVKLAWRPCNLVNRLCWLKKAKCIMFLFAVCLDFHLTLAPYKFITYLITT